MNDYPTLKASLRRFGSVIALANLGIAGCSSGHDDPAASADQAAIGADATAVESRTSEIPVYNAQTRAFTAADLCRVLNQEGVDLGEAKVTCSERAGGVLTLSASKGELQASIVANASDKLVVEDRGSNEVHQYKNNLGQTLLVEFEFVASGTRRTWRGVEVDGSYRADLLFGNADGRFRFGYYFNKKL